MSYKKFGNRILAFVGLVLIVLSSMIVMQASAANSFTIVVLPDTQYYSESYPWIFEAQTQWIVDNKDALKIVYVAHGGDIVNMPGSTDQWDNADIAMSLLEDPVTTGLSDGIPYGVVPGNHDEPTTNYNNYFGVSRFQTRSYYGDGYPSGSNDNNYTLFSASGINFIVINLEYVTPATSVLDWAENLLQTYSNRQAIIVSHYLIDSNGTFGSWGQTIYAALQHNPNLFLMLCGHIAGEARRTDTYYGNTVNTLLADYQSRGNGGNGWLRILEFSPENDEIRVRTYSPYLDQYETDADSQFTLDFSMTPKPDIKANGSDGPLNISSGDPLSIVVELDPGNHSDENADWWVLAATPSAPPDDWYYYNLLDWVPGFSVAYQAPLFDLSPYEVLNMSGLPVGSYTFYFGVDMIMNGSLDMGQSYYDSVEVEITPEVSDRNNNK